MIKTNTIGIVLMASSIIDKKSPRPGCRAEHRATDLRGRTRRKRASQSLGRLHLSSCYFSQAFEDRHFRKCESKALCWFGTSMDWMQLAPNTHQMPTILVVAVEAAEMQYDSIETSEIS
jgi:hypothetical protein